jgi:hypothetical protein
MVDNPFSGIRSNATMIKGRGTPFNILFFRKGAKKVRKTAKGTVKKIRNATRFLIISLYVNLPLAE